MNLWLSMLSTWHSLYRCTHKKLYHRSERWTVLRSNMQRKQGGWATQCNSFALHASTGLQRICDRIQAQELDHATLLIDKSCTPHMHNHPFHYHHQFILCTWRVRIESHDGEGRSIPSAISPSGHSRGKWSLHIKQYLVWDSIYWLLLWSAALFNNPRWQHLPLYAVYFVRTLIALDLLATSSTQKWKNVEHCVGKYLLSTI